MLAKIIPDILVLKARSTLVSPCFLDWHKNLHVKTRTSMGVSYDEIYYQLELRCIKIL